MGEIENVHQMMRDGLDDLTADQRSAVRELITASVQGLSRGHKEMQAALERVLGLESRVSVPAGLFACFMAMIETGAIYGHALGYSREQWIEIVGQKFDGLRVVPVAVDAPMQPRGKA